MQQKEIVISMGLFVIAYGIYCYLNYWPTWADQEKTAYEERDNATIEMVSTGDGRAEAMYSLLGGATGILGALLLL